jgi:hypothetical protein
MQYHIAKLFAGFAAGAIWDLNSNALRPAGWTSADPAGFPILPGLVRYDPQTSEFLENSEV